MPCSNVFDRQGAAYQAQVLPLALPTVAIEAAHPDFWRKYVGRGGAVLGAQGHDERVRRRRSRCLGHGQEQTLDAHAEAERPHPGVDLRLIRPERLRRLEHQRPGAGEADEDDDEAGDDGGEGQIAEEGHAVQGRKANAIVAERCSGSLAAARIMPAWHQSISGHSTLW